MRVGFGWGTARSWIVQNFREYRRRKQVSKNRAATQTFAAQEVKSPPVKMTQVVTEQCDTSFDDLTFGELRRWQRCWDVKNWCLESLLNHSLYILRVVRC